MAGIPEVHFHNLLMGTRYLITAYDRNYEFKRDSLDRPINNQPGIVTNKIYANLSTRIGADNYVEYKLDSTGESRYTGPEERLLFRSLLPNSVAAVGSLTEKLNMDPASGPIKDILKFAGLPLPERRLPMGPEPPARPRNLTFDELVQGNRYLVRTIGRTNDFLPATLTEKYLIGGDGPPAVVVGFDNGLRQPGDFNNFLFRPIPEGAGRRRRKTRKSKKSRKTRRRTRRGGSSCRM